MKSFSLPTLLFGTETFSALSLIFIYLGAYFCGNLGVYFFYYLIFLLAGENKTAAVILCLYGELY